MLFTIPFSTGLMLAETTVVFFARSVAPDDAARNCARVEDWNAGLKRALSVLLDDIATTSA
jgi:hypothetical protein